MTFLLACNLKIVIKWWGLTFGDGSGGWGNKHLVGGRGNFPGRGSG